MVFDIVSIVIVCLFPFWLMWEAKRIKGKELKT